MQPVYTRTVRLAPHMSQEGEMMTSTVKHGAVPSQNTNLPSNEEFMKACQMIERQACPFPWSAQDLQAWPVGMLDVCLMLALQHHSQRHTASKSSKQSS